MSLPNYLANIKSSGFYRFVWDKSTVTSTQAETLRLLIGYSEKGPFNTPVYLNNQSEFITTYGNISKKLERKGIYFHRLALQALTAGPILALNLKPFESEKISYLQFDPVNIYKLTEEMDVKQADVRSVYDTNRFWYIDADQLPNKVTTQSTKYITIAATDNKDSSCTIFMRRYVPKSYDITIREWYNEDTNEDMPDYLAPIQDNKLSDYFAEIYVFRGKFTPELCGPGGALSDYFTVYDSDGAPLEQIPEDGYTGDEKIALKKDYKNIFDEDSDALETMSNDSKSHFIYKYQGCLFPYFKDANGSYISLDVMFNLDNYDHKLLMKMDESILEETDDIQSIFTPAEPEVDPDVIPLYIPGYEYTSITAADKDKNLQDKILNVLVTEKGIRTALTNRTDIEYHYLVDTFNSYIEGGCKSKLSLLAKEKDNTFAILNMPPMTSFVNDKKFETNGKFDISKVANAANGFNLSSETNGASWSGYFTQVVFSDGTLKSTVPSSALVSNNFMNKWSSRQPYYIVAGPTYGVISYDGLVGPDYNYGRSDLDVLEPMGVNAIIYVPRKGTYINSNQTAKQTPVSALSKIHIRELVIYLQDEIESMLQDYQWELNTQSLRDTIKGKADYILEKIKDNNGIYDYNTVCDETNNTPEVIDNEMVVLNVDIEPARGSGKMCQILTIHRTGGISSQG